MRGGCGCKSCRGYQFSKELSTRRACWHRLESGRLRIRGVGCKSPEFLHFQKPRSRGPTSRGIRLKIEEMRVQILPRPFLKTISKAHVAQQQRRWSQKPEVAGANPAMGTNFKGISTGQACRGRLLNVRICGSRLGCKSSGFRHFQNARVAQLAEAPVLETGGWGCKSLHEYHFQNPLWQS